MEDTHLIDLVADGLSTVAAPNTCHHQDSRDAEDPGGFNDIAVAHIVHAFLLVSVRGPSQGCDGGITAIQGIFYPL